MTLRRLINGLGALLVLGVLVMALPGCGEGGASTPGPSEEVKVVPPVNPAPGALEPESPLGPDAAPKAK